jgi:hypothetical protein
MCLLFRNSLYFLLKHFLHSKVYPKDEPMNAFTPFLQFKQLKEINLSLEM